MRCKKPSEPHLEKERAVGTAYWDGFPSHGSPGCLASVLAAFSHGSDAGTGCRHMDFLRDELGLQDLQDCWQAAHRHTHLLQAFAACMALTALFMYLLFRSPSLSMLLSDLKAPQLSIHWHLRVLYTAACWPDKLAACKPRCE